MRWLCLLALAACTRAESPALTVAAAMSLRAVLPAQIEAFRRQHRGGEILVTYGASGDQRKQVEEGAPVDLVIFASGAPVDALVRSGHADPSSRLVLATNALVLIGPTGTSSAKLTFATIDQIPKGERIAIGDPGAVPAGQYARDAIQRLGKWSAVESHLVLASDVAAALAYTRRGEVVAAIVYRTETRGIADIVVLDEAKGDWAPRAEVVSATIKTSRTAERARAFAQFLAGAEGQGIFSQFGFGPP